MKTAVKAGLAGARIGRPLENSRLAVLELLLENRNYQGQLIDSVIGEAEKVIDFLAKDNLYQPNATPRKNAVIPKGTCIKLAGVEYYPVEDVQLGEIDGRDQEKLAMAIFSVKEGSKDEILRADGDVQPVVLAN